MSADLKAKLFRGFADPARLAILESLRHRPRCVSELVKITGLLQPNLSMHLACLRDCGLVRAERNGRFVHYQLAMPGVSRMLEAADGVLHKAAASLAACPRYGGRKRANARER